MNSKHYRKKPKIQQFERRKVFKGINDPPSPIKWEFIEEEEEEVKPLTKWEKVKKWFLELPIWSIR